MKFIDFFAGIGGFRLGMELAGHECVGHCEIDKFADKSYRAMHNPKEGEWYADDICRVEPGELPEADIWTGGFPCQAFSVAGKRRGFEDMRGTLIFEIFRLAAERKPRILFLENVKGLLNHEGGRTFGIILDGLWELGYDVQWQVLNSKNFGVPQNRERVFIIGHLGEGSGREIFPIHGTDGKTLNHIGNLQIDGRHESACRVYGVDGIGPCLNTCGGGGLETKILLTVRNGAIEKRKDFSCLDANYHKGFDNHGERTGVLEVRPVLTPDRAEKRQNGRRMKESGEEMFTLTAQDRHGVAIKPKHIPGPNEVNNTLRASGHQTPTPKHNFDTIHDGVRIRRLTPRECFRLQGFPDEYFDRAAAVNSDSQLYKQAGNSVTVNVIYEIAKRF